MKLLWEAGPRVPALGPGEIHVWAADVDGDAGRAGPSWGMLSEDERARADRYRFERDRARYVLRTAVLRSLLGGYGRVEPEALSFGSGPHGKPCLAGPAEAAGLRFNLSHSHGLALIAVTATREVGVDVERVRPLEDAGDVSESMFHRAEAAALRGLPAEQRLRAFYDCWTRKEAFLKATGEGLDFPLNRFEVSVDPAEPPRLRAIDGDAERALAWRVWRCEPAEGFAGALVSTSCQATICSHRWSNSAADRV